MSLLDSRLYNQQPISFDTYNNDEISPQSSNGRSPFSSLGFLRNLGDRKVVKEIEQPKRRGPKPDSRPAQSRRQELNRTAQRTHRQRKEQYVKTLEAEVMGLKELYGESIRERDRAIAEAQRLRDVLTLHGIPFDSTPGSSYDTYTGSGSGSGSGSRSESYRRDSTTTGTAISSPDSSRHTLSATPTASFSGSRVDYDQTGIDFVLALEKPCMQHIQYLVVRSANVQGQAHHHPGEREDDDMTDHMSGHALMATCPPMTHIMEKPAEPYGYKMPDIRRPDLLKLLQASSKLPGIEGGEITPIKAWLMIVQDPHIHMLDAQDLLAIQTELLNKVRCYGFGAVLEEFEIRDALSNVFEAKGICL